MSNATVLQTAANRFSKAVGFAPIAVDGKIGAQTLSATRMALTHIKNSFDVEDTTIDDAALWLSKIQTAAILATNAGPVGQFLNQAADEQGHGYVVAPVASSGGGGIAPSAGGGVVYAPLVPSAGAGVIDAWRALATWKKIALGAFAGFLLIFLHGRYKRSRGLSGASSTLWLYTYRNKHGGFSDVWAHDAEHAREQIRRKKDRPSGFYSISRVTNVPARKVA